MAKEIIEKANVVFKETSAGDKFEVLKTRDNQLKLGGVYSEDLVDFYEKTNDGVVVLNYSGDVIPKKIAEFDDKGFLTDLYVDTYAEPAGVMTADYLYGSKGIVANYVSTPELLKVGDYAKVINNEDANLKLPLGSIVKITGDYLHIYAYSYVTLDGCRRGEAFGYRFAKATDEEVAEAKRQQAENAVVAKWSSINRKPNEFKKGDIVRVDSVCFSNKVGEVSEVEPKNYFEYKEGLTLSFFDGSGGWTYKKNCELITPVEARFDMPPKGDR